jgi:cold shock CspA family protein
MRGIVKKFDSQGFGIIASADGSKLPFTLSDVLFRKPLEPGQKVVFSVRKVNDKSFAMNVSNERRLRPLDILDEGGAGMQKAGTSN